MLTAKDFAAEEKAALLKTICEEVRKVQEKISSHRTEDEELIKYSRETYDQLVKTVHHRIEDLENEIARREQVNGELENENGRLKQECHELAEENNSLTEEKNSLAEKNNSLTEEKDALLAEQQKNLQQMRSIQEAQGNLELRLKEREQEIITLKTELDQHKNQHKKELEKALKSAENAVSEKQLAAEKEAMQIRERYDILDKELAKTLKLVESAEMDKREAEASLNRIQEQWETMVSGGL